jgi:integrase
MVGENVSIFGVAILQSRPKAHLQAARAGRLSNLAGGRRFLPPVSFHATRHSAITAVYRATHDLFLAQRFARHASPLTTTVYTHVSDEEMFASLRGLAC